MIEPSERLLWLLVLAAAVGTLGLVAPPIGAAAPYIVVGVMAAVLLDFSLAGSPRKLQVRRVLPEIIVEGRPVEIGVEITAPRRVDVDVCDTLPARGGAAVVAEYRVTVAPGERCVARCVQTFRRRGAHTFGRIALRTVGPLGLLQRRERRTLQDGIHVLLDLATIALRAEGLLRGSAQQGVRRRQIHGDGREFESLREYRRGDDIRLVDWKRSARHSELVVKNLRPETRQDVVVCFDAGRQMCGRHAELDGGWERFEAGLQVGMTLAAAALLRGDRCGVVAFADETLGFAAPAEGRRSLRTLAGAIKDVDAAPVEADYARLASGLIVSQRRRALICIVTDVVDEPSARALALAVAVLRQRHVVTVVAMGDPGLARLARSADEAVADAAERLLEHRRRAIAALRAAGAIVVDTPSAQAAVLAVDAYLTIKGQGQL